ncbi:hypothetical protein QE152_g1790 [Popillia japonica]|uniref:Uncharacterized protein n=1 Tax=Popillia japonica TaxID=7064 RepID=A0AAW1N4I4_POPJA
MTSPVTKEISDPAAILALHRCNGLAAQQCEYIAPKTKSKYCRGGAGSRADPVRNRRLAQPLVKQVAPGCDLEPQEQHLSMDEAEGTSTSVDDASDSDRAPIQDARKRRIKWTNEKNEFIIRSYYKMDKREERVYHPKLLYYYRT